MDYSLGQIFGGAAIVFVVGILIVFLALAVIILILVLMANIFKAADKRKAGVTPAAPTPAPAPAVTPAPSPAIEFAGDEDEEEIAAVIAAVVAMMSESGNGLVVRSVRRVGKNTPVWSASGRQEYMDTRY